MCFVSLCKNTQKNICKQHLGKISILKASSRKKTKILAYSYVLQFAMIPSPTSFGIKGSTNDFNMSRSQVSACHTSVGRRRRRNCQNSNLRTRAELPGLIACCVFPSFSLTSVRKNKSRVFWKLKKTRPLSPYFGPEKPPTKI